MSDRQAADKALDEVIAKFDETLPALRKMASSKKQKKATDRLPADKAEQAKAVFQDMCEDSLLTEKGDDICLCAKGQRKKGKCPDQKSA